MRKARRAATSGGGSGKELLVFTVFLVVVMITLSQVLVVHHKYNVRYGQGAKPRSIRLKAQQELRQVERRIAALRHQNIPSLQQAAESLQKHVFISRIASLIQRATHESRHLMQHRLQPSNSSNHSSSSTWSSSPVSASQSLLLSALDYDLQETDIDASASLSEWNVSAASWGDNDNVTDDELEGGPANITTPSPVQLLCPEEPPLLWGNVSADVNREHETLTLSEVMAAHPDIRAGGEWQPSDCVARYRVAVVIPYRDRLAHLTVLLAHLLPVLKRQQLHFRVFVVEQYGTLTFNKGRIMNAAFKEALKIFDFQCVVFHDVDLIPEDDRNMYTCPIMPRHMSVAIDEMNYRLAYQMLVGGVLNMRMEHYQLVNGYSNMYWGWGAEDDDM
ncbi:beta-1,4-N-acetylgalactosaminyltransferase bre-4-like [Pomacea canaliculata]|uniref:beta-1,4-N-acetylgalactosaminyltransferase bre-4-like n=1 Tax=Pomacea canaliculata TaxID=400727 RepID=UPI000D73D096|nr:beta-1,4-N-acetylgalactosaminyltransferase bre-4-like [Pomacea canaliculata]